MVIECSVGYCENWQSDPHQADDDTDQRAGARDSQLHNGGTRVIGCTRLLPASFDRTNVKASVEAFFDVVK